MVEDFTAAFFKRGGRDQSPNPNYKEPSNGQKRRAARKVQKNVRRWLRANREPAAERAVLRISISSADALKNKELLGTSDPYCQFTLSGRYTNVVRRTKARGATPLPAQ